MSPQQNKFQSFKYSYRLIQTEVGQVPYPVIPVFLINRKKEILRDFIVDTGADTTTLPKYLAKELNINLRNLPRAQSQGISEKPTKTWETRIKLKIGDEIIRTRCSFVASNKIPPLLGKLDIFSHFNLYFDNDRSQLVIIKRSEHG